MNAPPGWFLYVDPLRGPEGDAPWRHGAVELWREGWSEAKRVKYLDIPPHFNVADLYWRPANEV